MAARWSMTEALRFEALDEARIEAASAMMLRIFDRYNAPGFPPEGRLAFFEAASPDALRVLHGEGNVILLALVGEEIVGVFGMSTTRHVKLMFVHGDYHRRGIAAQLWALGREQCLERDPSDAPFTLNATDYAVPAYQRLGFTQSAERSTKNGITFTPMTMPAQKSPGPP